MKKMNTCLIACAVVAVASINSYAAVVVSGPGDSISLVGTAVDTAVNGYLASADSVPRSFTMTGGTVDVTSTFDGSAGRGVYTDSTAGGAVVNISGGTMTVSESGDKDAALIRMNDHEDSLTISGGTFNLTESGLGGAYGIRVIRDVPVNISGGTFNFSQDDSSVGGIFVGGGAAETTINLSGGLFNNLDQFDTHISLSDLAVMNFSVLSLTDTGLTVDGGTGLITEKTGTIAGTLADGNAFSFVFENLESSSMTVTVIPEPATLGLIVASGVSVLFIRRRLML
ncbi:PEP-CTERM sorting domain-containing protein [Pontiellaceae bacterium B12227]|nr:PEP-CTERM sorting domain-containing protein [Pontiellaceae bacterium B12227]